MKLASPSCPLVGSIDLNSITKGEAGVALIARVDPERFRVS